MTSKTSYRINFLLFQSEVMFLTPILAIAVEYVFVVVSLSMAQFKEKEVKVKADGSICLNMKTGTYISRA